jgi:hypothetical protein
MQAEWMKPVFAELVNNSDTFEVLMSPDKPYFRLSVKGMAGEAYVCECAGCGIRRALPTSVANGLAATAVATASYWLCASCEISIILPKTVSINSNAGCWRRCFFLGRTARWPMTAHGCFASHPDGLPPRLRGHRVLREPPHPGEHVCTKLLFCCGQAYIHFHLLYQEEMFRSVGRTISSLHTVSSEVRVLQYI